MNPLPSAAILGDELRRGARTSVALVRECLDRIEERDPQVRAILGVAPDALAAAAAADRRLAAGTPASPLDGMPIVLKDSIDTAGLLSTSGSRLLAPYPPRRDAAIVAALRRAGMIVLAKTNLSEWSGFRSQHMVEGWSSLGGQTRHADDPRRSPWGSSSGSAVAVAAGMAPLALGTETDGSIVGPAGQNGVVGVKPEYGFLPLAGVAGISPAQDTLGPFAATLDDALQVLCVLNRGGLGEPRPSDLAGRRIGIWIPDRSSPPVRFLFDGFTAALRGAGAVPVDVRLDDQQRFWSAEMRALLAEFVPGLHRYLRRRGPYRTLAALVAGNAADPEILTHFGQETFQDALRLSRAERRAGRRLRASLTADATGYLTAALSALDVAVVAAPTNEPAWVIDYACGDPATVATSTLAAVTGRPNVSLPLGRADGLPAGVSLFGPPALAGLAGDALAVEALVASGARCGPNGHGTSPDGRDANVR
jgi:amidase